MAIMIDPASAQDVDQPLITNPDYTFTHVFSTALLHKSRVGFIS